MRTLAPALTLAACLAFPAVALADIPPDSESDTDDPTTTGMDSDSDGTTETTGGTSTTEDSDGDSDADSNGDDGAESSGCSFTAKQDTPLAIGALVLLVAGFGLRRREA